MAATRLGRPPPEPAGSASPALPSSRILSGSPIRGPSRPIISSGGSGLAPAEVVEGEGGVAESGEALGPALGVVVESGPLMTNEYAGKQTLPLVIDRQVPDHAISADRVLDVLYPHTPSSSTRWVITPCILARTPRHRSVAALRGTQKARAYEIPLGLASQNGERK
jgi:hypothetical protein